MEVELCDILEILAIQTSFSFKLISYKKRVAREGCTSKTSGLGRSISIAMLSQPHRINICNDRNIIIESLVIEQPWPSGNALDSDQPQTIGDVRKGIPS